MTTVSKPMIRTAAAAAALMAATAAQGAAPCGFTPAFERPDEGGSTRVQVYEGAPDPALGGRRPLAFVTSLKANSDGTRTSYKVDDPHGDRQAINDIRYAIKPGKTVKDFEALARAGWRPESKVWSVVEDYVIEKDARTGKPCMDAEGYLVSMTADVAVADGWGRIGDCDQSKWLDALTIPSMVLPSDGGGFEARGALTRSAVAAMTLGGASRLAYGIVGDLGPPDELGEGSIEMNRILNGLPENPTNYRQVENLFGVPDTVVMVFPGEENRMPYPITGEGAVAFSRARFEAWGGEARLRGCLAELGAAQAAADQGGEARSRP